MRFCLGYRIEANTANHSYNMANVLGSLPIISTIIGIVRVLLFSLACAGAHDHGSKIEEREKHRYYAICISHIARGTIEISGVYRIALVVADLAATIYLRIKSRNKQA